MKISVITATFNSARTLEDCFESLRGQTHRDVEHIVIDGGSTDGTAEIIRRNAERISYWASEPDGGVFYALNKGLRRATGDVIGFLHSDDRFADPGVLESIARGLAPDHIDAVYGDLHYVSATHPDRVIRDWKAGEYRRGAFRLGWMPPHPTFYARRRVYERLGPYREELRISADYEWLLRFFEIEGFRAGSLDRLMVKMRVGGNSNRSVPTLIRKSWEDYRSWLMNGLSMSPTTLFLKNVLKIRQFFPRRG